MSGPQMQCGVYCLWMRDITTNLKDAWAKAHTTILLVFADSLIMIECIKYKQQIHNITTVGHPNQGNSAQFKMISSIDIHGTE